MKQLLQTFFAGLLASGILVSAATPPLATAVPPLPLRFDGANWIWFTPDVKMTLEKFPEGVVFFRTAFVLPKDTAVAAAEVAVTADNLYTLHVNGKVAGESDTDPNAWHLPGRFNVTRLLVPGRNVLALEATNTAPGPAGLILSLTVRLADGRVITVNSGGDWKASDTADVDWPRPGFDDASWPAARVLGPFGMAPWGRIVIPAENESAPPTADSEKTVAGGETKLAYPIIFIGDDCSLSREKGHSSLSINIFNVRNTRAFPEYDLPLPVKIGRRLFSFTPGTPATAPKLLLDAGTGAIGSPSVSFDGRFLYFTMAAAGDAFYHIYRLPAEGGQPQQLTSGPFHDLDPTELPDGRIVFSSTRAGTYDEYHGAPARALFSMDAKGGDIRVVTPTFNFDNEPRVMADGRLLFVRTDNFFDRAKVETLLHATRPDGTGGQAAFALDNGPEYGGRLRKFNCGSPAPLPDGRVAFVTGGDIVVARPGDASRDWRHLRQVAADLSAMPDGRLLCTLPPASDSGKKNRYTRIGIVDPGSKDGRAEILFDGGRMELHSPVLLAPRPTPPVLAEAVDRQMADRRQATGFMICQNARITRNTTAGWSHVRAVRVLAGKGLTLRSSHSYLVHSGSEAVELGTVPLAPDGSFAIEVPADTPIAFQLVDAEGRSELNEMSWNAVRPGERRSCVGCHEARQASPPLTAVQAMKAPPVRLQLQNDPPRFRANNPAVTGLMEVQFDRFREVASLNRNAISIPDLIVRLSGDDPAVAFSAAQRLALERNPAAAPALATALGHTEREVRMAVAMALAACGTRESVPSLLAALDDSDPLVAQAAVVALENLTGHAESAFNPFVRSRKPESWRDWFRTTSWDAIERELVARLANPDRAVVRRAAVTLGHTGAGEAARTALRQCLEKERNNQAYAEWHKHHRGDHAQYNDLAPVNPRTAQAVARALGGMRDCDAVPLLAGILGQHANPATGNLFLAEAAAEALGQIGTPEARKELADAFTKLASFEQFTQWYGDHSALMACHASPIHYFIIKALAEADSAPDAALLPAVIRSVPVDFDRGLFFENDGYETAAGRLLQRNDPAGTVAETCLALLGDPQAKSTPAIAAALAKTPRCWAGNATPEIRAAQILSLVCHDRTTEPRIRAALLRYAAKPVKIQRVFDKGVPVVLELPLRHWACFFLTRTLGNLADPQSAEPLAVLLAESAPEAATGHPDPTGNGVLFLHNDLTPCWRAAVAWALGRIGDRRAAPALLKVVGNLDNAPDTRCAAAEALERIADPASLAAIRELAATYPETATRAVLQRLVSRSGVP